MEEVVLDQKILLLLSFYYNFFTIPSIPASVLMSGGGWWA